ncbi:MAG: helix-turn-helix domain-containing protein [Thiolinea sp.]
MSAVKLAGFLRKAIKESDLTQTEISAKANISRQTLYRVQKAEISEMKLSTMVGVCNALKLDPHDVLGIYFGRKTI